MSVRDGRIVLPDGMSYHLLALPESEEMSPLVLRKIVELVENGATIVGQKPSRAPGLKDYPRCDEEVGTLAGELWGNCDGRSVTQRGVGKGRIFWSKALREILLADGVPPDFKYGGGRKDALLDYIHRRDGKTEIYFVVNRLNRWEELNCTFRVPGKAPELWNPLTGEIRRAAAYTQASGRTTLPLEFAPYGSIFVVFRKPAAARAGTATRNSPVLSQWTRLGGPWTVKFDPKWGGLEEIVFEKLEDWTKRPEEGIKYYSGKATYAKTFDLPGALHRPGKRLYLDLGKVKNVAEVRLNGNDLGVVWTAPWRVEITDAVRPAGNTLEIGMVNLWPNRLIGDAGLPPAKRLTMTNVKKFKKDSPLLESGLLGPVTLQIAER